MHLFIALTLKSFMCITFEIIILSNSSVPFSISGYVFVSSSLPRKGLRSFKSSTYCGPTSPRTPKERCVRSRHVFLSRKTPYSFYEMKEMVERFSTTSNVIRRRFRFAFATYLNGEFSLPAL